jgi:ABC-type polysaccharide/polyol phosphate transport system ATPase subunit
LDQTKPQTLCLIYPQPHGSGLSADVNCEFWDPNKQYGKQVLFVDASFQLHPGEKVGLVGPRVATQSGFRQVD